MPGGAPLAACLLQSPKRCHHALQCVSRPKPQAASRGSLISHRESCVSIRLGFPEKKNICTCPAWLSTSRAPAAVHARSRSSECAVAQLQQCEAGGLHTVLLLSVLQQCSFCSPGSVLPGIAAKGRRGRQHKVVR